LSSTADWRGDGTQSYAEFAASVGTAGDVNGDGYSDVIIGAPWFDNVPDGDEGRAYVYHGSATGLASSPNWTEEGNQVLATFGTSVATAGDVNGDGYSDVIVGAPLYDNGQTDEGRAYVYHGSATGLSFGGNWTAESNQGSANFGTSVGTAGDVNGDGYADVIVGAPQYDNGQLVEGRAYAFHGSATGLSGLVNWTRESNQAMAFFGWSVGTAGDIQGDGYADVIVGSLLQDNGQADEGRAFVYSGGGGRGVSLNPRQRRSDNVTPIAPLGKTNHTNAMNLDLKGRIPFDRGLVKLEWEAKPLGVNFDGTGTLKSPNWFDTGTSGVELSQLVTGMISLSSYHWRVRLVYHAVKTPFAQHSRWVTMPWNGWNEKDVLVSL
jgi:hypothetical protein